MKKQNTYVLLLLILLTAFSAVSVSAQRRDHLTKEEIELVRDVQDIEQRMVVFTRAIERRMLVLDGVEKITKEEKKSLEKESEKWGELPSGKNAELFSDIGKILNESIDKFEDFYERKPDSDEIPWAFYVLADYAEALVPRLKTLAAATTDRREISLLETAGDDCVQILKARENITRPSGKRKKRKKS